MTNIDHRLDKIDQKLERIEKKLEPLERQRYMFQGGWKVCILICSLAEFLHLMGML